MALPTEPSSFETSEEEEGKGEELDSTMGFLCLFGNPPCLTGTPSRTSTSLTWFLDAQVTTNSMILWMPSGLNGASQTITQRAFLPSA
jgi:hypothetical protein